MAYDDLTGRKVRITIPAAYRPEHYDATVIAGPDSIGTITFRRHEDDFLGIAGLGAWVLLEEAPRD